MEKDNIVKINNVIAKFFGDNPSITSVPAKELMPLFIDAKIFTKNHRDGLPTRKILRVLDEENLLHIILSIRPE